MKQIFIILSLIFCAIGCKNEESVNNNWYSATSFLSYDPFIQTNFDFYSKEIDDTFNIFVSLPRDYNNQESNYPVVYVLDANVAFEMAVISMKLISHGLGCHQAIYIGIGYKDIGVMDSLRFRDYSFPPDFNCCGAKVFSNFLEGELIPAIDKKYRTQPSENLLIGHSLSGYFVMYNFLQSAIDNKLSFKGYVAGSAFIGNDKMFIDLEQKLYKKVDSLPVKLFMCSGTIEDTDSMQIVFADILDSRNYQGFEYKSIILNDFGHMDMLFPTWTKGLRYMLRYE